MEKGKGGFSSGRVGQSCAGELPRLVVSAATWAYVRVRVCTDAGVRVHVRAEG